MKRIFSNVYTKIEALESDFARLPIVGKALILVAMAVVLNLNTLTVGFLTDDYWLLDGVVHRGVVLTGQWMQGLSYYRPLVMISLWLNERMFGTNPVGYHNTNILVHTFTVCVLYGSLTLIGRRASKDSVTHARASVIGAFLLSLAFVVHPANAHDVVWISGRTDLIAGLFIILVVFFFLKGEEVAGRNWKVISMIMFILALGAKEIAVVTPFLLLALSIELALLRREERLSFADLRKCVWEEIRQCSLFFAIDAVYIVVRLMMFHFSDPIADFSTVGIRELLLFVARVGFLLVSPIDPLSAVNLFAVHPIAVIVVAILVTGLIIYIVVSSGWSSTSNTYQAFAVFIIGVACCFVPFLSRVSIAQRLMYVPLLFTIVLLAPFLAVNQKHKERPTARSMLVLASVFGFLVVFGASYQYNLAAWKKASLLEKSLIDEIVAQTDNPRNPIIIIDYPLRVGQANILYYLPCRLYFAFSGEFGTNDSVFTGFCVVSPSFRNIGQGINFASEDSTLSRFTISSDDPLQFFYPDPYTEEFEHGIPIREAGVGQSVANQLLVAKVLRVNETLRMTSCEAEILHPSILAHAQVFIFQDGHMKRLR